MTVTTPDELPQRRWIDRRSSRVLIIVQAVINIIALVALVIALIGLLSINEARTNSARDSCVLIKGLVTASTAGHPESLEAANNYIQNTPLKDCDTYAHSIVK